MGALLAKFRKEKSSADVLEKLEADIRAIQEFSHNTQEKQKRLVGNFLVISIGLYAIGFVIFYFVFFPPTWMERITYSVPLLIFPLLIFILRRLLSWYFQRKINKNSIKLKTLQAEKKRILEEVMEKETYNVASKLLSKYGQTPQPNRASSESRIQYLNTSLSTTSSTQPFSQAPLNRTLLSMTNNGQSTISPTTPRSFIASTNSASVLRHRISPPSQAAPSTRALIQPRPYPIINQKTQGLLDKMVDYLIGDGPQNRYALICKECFAHNGMARQEEFDYVTFRCAFCNTLNPSRKARPVAPKLATSNVTPLSLQTGRLSNASDSSSTDSSDESSEPPQLVPLFLPQKQSKESTAPLDDNENENENLNEKFEFVPTKEREDESQNEQPQSEEKTADPLADDDEKKAE